MTEGLLGTLAKRNLPREQVRFATVLNGGVSLAVWMGGVAVEIDRLVKQSATTLPLPATEDWGKGFRGDGVYAALLAFAGSTARVDIISGTSAGGINGAALALAQANPNARLRVLRDLWADHGDIRNLLRQPFQGAPTSLLRGDEYFLPRLQDMLQMLARNPVKDRPVPPLDVTITATVLHGNQTVRVDSMGTLLPQELHAGQFNWRSTPSYEKRSSTDDKNPFDPTQLEQTAQELALASRTTASFPFAFEPVFVPVSPVAPFPERPDMARIVTSWGDAVPGQDRSRYAVDGGLLANTPTEATLKAISLMEADADPIRRVVLLVYPHAPEPGDNPADKPDEPPTVVETLLGLVTAATAEGNRTFVDEIDDHNERAAGRRGARRDVVSGVGGDVVHLEALVEAIHPHYRKLVVWRAGRDLAKRATDLAASANAVVLRDEGWSYERVRRAAEAAQEGWLVHAELPYVSKQAPKESDLTDRYWRWGDSTALGVVDAIDDVLAGALRLLPDSPLYEPVGAARKLVSQNRQKLLRLREELDSPWEGPVDDPIDDRSSNRRIVQQHLIPNQAYWTLRLASYARQMAGGSESEVRVALADVIQGVDEPWRDKVRQALESLLSLEPSTAVPSAETTIGEKVRGLVDACVLQLAAILGQLGGPVMTSAGGARAIDLDVALTDWRTLLRPPGGTNDPRTVLLILLQVEMATTALGDEVRSEASNSMDLIQLSAATTNAFTHYTRTADDKLGGWSVHRFGGFLKRSWRVNDWIWGRVDAATMLCRTILDPERVRRTAELSGYLEGATTDTAGELAAETVEELCAVLFGTPVPDPSGQPDISEAARKAVTELATIFDPARAEDLPAALPALANLFALALHAELVAAEIPALAAAIRVDRVQGAYHQSRGAVFLEDQSDLLDSLETAARSGATVDLTTQLKALGAFDRAGIGREPLADESRSDAMIQTVTTAGAVGVTLLDSSRSGLSAIKPATRALRGAALVPYWTLSGLASQAGLFRNLAFLSLALGGALLVLAVFGALPESLLVPAATVGGGAIVVALAYGAMRSGTMLHGLVLLPTGIVLTSIGIKMMYEQAEAHRDVALNGAFGAGALVALSLALIVLGSLPGNNRTVVKTLIELVRQPRRLFGGLGRLALAAAGLYGVWRLAVLLAGAPWLRALRWAIVHQTLVIWIGVVLTVIGTGLAIGLSWWLKLFRRHGDEGKWALLPLADSAGVAAGWSVVYGAGYLAICLALLLRRPEWLTEGQPWIRITVGAAVLAGVLLIIVVPVVLPLRSLTALARREVDRARMAGMPKVEDGKSEELRAAYVDDLAVRANACRGHLKIERGTTPEGTALVLTSAGGRMYRRAVKATQPRAN